MKKIYLLVIMFLGLFSFNLFANGVKINNASSNLKGGSIVEHSVSKSKSISDITIPTTNPTVSSTSICQGDNLTLTANPSGGVAPYTYSWTGPNGYISSTQNPVINNISLSGAGVYSLIITDFLGAVSTIQNTAAVVVNTKIDPTFDATLPAICKGGTPPLLSTTSTNGISGSWNPPLVNNQTTTTYLFTPDFGQCANSLSFTIFVINNVAPIFTLPTSICQGDTPPILPTISNNGIVGTWNPAIVSGTTSGSYTFSPSIGQCATVITITININPSTAIFIPAVAPICSGDFLAPLPTTSSNGVTGNWSPALNNTATTTYTFTPTSSQCASASTSMTIVVNPLTATFDPVAPICSGGTLAALPTTSSNGVTGTWSPIINNTATTTYTFTPTAGQCDITPTNLTIVVNPLIATFDPVAPICSGDILADLPTTSTNGITGTWSPPINNTATTTYTFTPTSAQCATTPATLTIVVNPLLATFDPVAPICSGQALAALPTTSTNGVTGTWSPIINNTATTTYTFTPTAGQCDTTPTNMTIIVNPIIATFDPVAPICSGDILADLPTTSTNGITGTWSPPINNTATTTYTFTPTSAQCATTPATLTIVVNPLLATFDPVAPICSGQALAALPTTSTNGVTGTWSPIINNTATTTYTFTPTAGQCDTTPTNMTIIVNPIIATFDPVAPICSGDILADLPTTSTNGITGTWSPAINNTATTTYTFKPTSAQCATTPATLTIVVNPLIATFAPIAPICFGGTLVALPTTSTNGVTGTWAPIINNTTTTTYTFTPTAGQCNTTPTNLTIVVNPIIATFNPVAPICSGDILADLPTTSTNGITGTWSPAINNTATTTYTFTPTSAQCATTPATLTIVVNPLLATFDPVAPICSGQALAALPTTSTNGVTGTWSPIINNTATTTYTFTPTAGQCDTTPTNMTIIVNPIIATFDPVAPICSGDILADLPTTSTNGITGTWSPIINNTATTTYTFTPTTGQCATTTTSLTIIVNPITAIFDSVAPICSGDALSDLPTTSTNGVSGTWSPAMNNTATTTYTFTPTSGQCAKPITMTIVVNQLIAIFNPVAPICSGDILADLPTTSANGVTGTWSPTINNTATTTYTFTPTSGQCATTTTDMTIVVNQKITPAFSAIAPICSGSTSPVLPTKSTNLITGTWNPATVSNTNSGTYTFTPDANQCAFQTTLDVTIIPNIIPSFDPIPDVCYGTTAPSLSNSSNNGIVGTWNPGVVSNTSSGTYTFTPDPNGPCATSVTLSINVTIITPSFNTIEPICANTTVPNLQSTSNNGIIGTWNPATIDNTTTGTYTFTPDLGQCAPPTTISVTVNPFVVPSFNAITPICFGSTIPVLPLISNNGYTGTWNPTTVSNTTTGTYTFTPDAGQCAFEATLDVTVIPNDTPTFTAIAPICSGSAKPVLPTTSNNLITGTWNPSTVSNTSSATYTFTPTVGLCALPTTLNVIVYQSPTDIVLKTTDVVNDGPDGIIEINVTTGGLSPYQYSINNSSFTPNLTYPNLLPGDYTITVQDANGCEFNKVATINSICMFPNAISPNGDKLNDIFNLNGCNVVKLEIFNRYGRKVNSYSNYTDQWDGTNSNGEALPDGTYFYVAEMKGGVSKSGWVFIAR